MSKSDLFFDIYYGDRVEFYRTINSTQQRIRQIYEKKPQKSLVLAREQTQGKGRRGSKWESPAGGLYLSVLVHFKGNEKLGSIFFLLSVLKPLLKLVPTIKWKWPNDIIIDGKKAGGIISEGLGNKWIGFGLGLNTGPSKKVFPTNLKNDISLVKINQKKFLDDMLKNLDVYRKKIKIPEEDLKLLNSSCFLKKKHIQISNRSGTALGIDRNGKLKLKTDTKIEKISAGQAVVTHKAHKLQPGLLAVDIGNTTTHIGIVEQKNNLRTKQIKTSTDKDYIKKLNTALSLITGNIKIRGAGLSSVVGPLTLKTVKIIKANFFSDLINITHLTDTGLKLDISHPETLGPDRICNAAAVKSIFKQNSVVVDMGTANTFDIITVQGTYTGGVISPGIKAMEKALTLQADKLHKINFNKVPLKFIGKNTAESLKSGLHFTLTGQIQTILSNIHQELDEKYNTIFTGGAIKNLEPAFLKNYTVAPNLTLKGICSIIEKNIY